jgi:hypothetical protein
MERKEKKNREISSQIKSFSPKPVVLFPTYCNRGEGKSTFFLFHFGVCFGKVSAPNGFPHRSRQTVWPRIAG